MKYAEKKTVQVKYYEKEKANALFRLVPTSLINFGTFKEFIMQPSTFSRISRRQ